MVIVSSATERDLGLMTNEEALTILKQPDRVGYNFIKGNSIEDVQYNIDSQTALAMAIKALECQKDFDSAVVEWADANGYALVAKDVWRDAKIILEGMNKETCEYCHEDVDGHIKPMEKNHHAYIRQDSINGWVFNLHYGKWKKQVKINFCPMCGRKLRMGELVC